MSSSTDPWAPYAPPSCPVCFHAVETEQCNKIIHESAKISAHLLAAAEAERTMDERFSFVDLYVLYFPRAYGHEYHRVRRHETAKQMLECLLETPEKICSYHTSQVQHEFDYKYGSNLTSTELATAIDDEYQRSVWSAKKESEMPAVISKV